LLPENYQEDAIPLYSNDNDPLRAFVVTGIDLAITKLDRLVEADQEDIISLYEAGKFTLEALEVHANDALIGVVGNEQRLRANINFMISRLKELP
jgi:hypothetical protein